MLYAHDVDIYAMPCYAIYSTLLLFADITCCATRRYAAVDIAADAAAAAFTLSLPARSHHAAAACRHAAIAADSAQDASAPRRHDATQCLRYLLMSRER